MTGLRKLLLFMLVLCTLGYSSAWAYDGHAFEPESQAVDSNNMSINITSINITGIDTGSKVQTSEQQPAIDDTCDHCCHISAHLVAVFTQNNCSFNTNQTSKRLEFSASFISFIVSPDLRPPRA